MKKTVILLLFLCFFTGCNQNDDNQYGTEKNPFVGTWKEDVNKWEFYDDGNLKNTMNYFGYGKTYTYTGMYAYNPKQQTVTFSFDGGSGRIYIVQEISRDRIVYFDPTDLATYYLVRIQ